MKRFMFAVMAIATIAFAGCSKDDGGNDTPIGNVQKAIDAISDKTSAKSIVVSGELTADDWELLEDIRDYLPAVENITLNDALLVKDVFGFTDWLKKISVPKAITIENAAFIQCAALTSVDAPLVEIIGEEAFSWCDQVAEFNFPKAIQVGEKAFYQCEKLTAITLPELTELNDDVFAFCELLASADFPKVTKINSDVFLGCTDLTAIALGATTNIEVTSHSFDSYRTEAITLDLSGVNVEEAVGKIWKGYTWKNITYLGQALPSPDFGVANWGSTIDFVRQYDTGTPVTGGGSNRLIRADRFDKWYIYNFDNDGKLISGETDESVQFSPFNEWDILRPLDAYQRTISELTRRFGEAISKSEDISEYNMDELYYRPGYGSYEAQVIMGGSKSVSYEFSNDRTSVISILSLYTRTGKYQPYGYTIRTTYSKR